VTRESSDFDRKLVTVRCIKCLDLKPRLFTLKTNLWAIASIVAALSFATSYTASSERDDHLIPPDPLFQNYRDLLALKLGQTPFNCGRVIVQPAFEGESSISVYCSPETSVGEKCYVVYTEASDNLWQQTNALQNTERANNVKIKRIDAGISATTGQSIRTAFSRILEMTQAQTVREDEMRALTPDATYTEFSLERPSGPPLSGELNVSLVKQGVHITKLRTLFRLLVEYCKTNRRNRPHIEQAIRKTATQLAGAR